MMNRKEHAIKLRTEGYSYSYIQKETGLAQSTLSYHLATVPYKPNEYTVRTMKLTQLRAASTKAKKKLQSIRTAQKFAQNQLGTITNRDLLIAGIALYAGEGSKTQDLVRLVNANPRIIRFFVRWLRLLGLPSAHILIRVHCYPDTDIEVAESYWLRVTGLSRRQLQPACIDTRIGKDRKRNGVHAYGTAHVTVKADGKKEFGVALSRKIKAYMEILLC